MQFHRVAIILIAIICGSICLVWVSWCGGLPLDVVVGGDPWICPTVASVVFLRIAHLARTSRFSYSLLLGPQAFCNSAIISPRRSSPPVESYNSASLATSRNSVQYSVTDRWPCVRHTKNADP